MFHLAQISAITTNLLPLAGAIIAFLSIITVHEFGHFIFCKLFNVKTPTFSIGVGPVIAKTQLWDTEFRLSILPLGGFVEIAGLGEPGQGEQAFAEDRTDRSFEIKPYWQKMLILCGGIVFNLLFAFIIYTSLYTTGMPRGLLTNIAITAVTDGGPADKAGLKAGDFIIGLNHKDFASEEGALAPSEFTKIIQTSIDKPLVLSILRNEGHTKLTIIPEAENPENPQSTGIIRATLSSSSTYSSAPGLDIATSAQKSIAAIYTQVSDTFKMIGSLFKEKSLSGIGGPVMIFSQFFKTARIGIKLLLLFVCYVNIGLAVMNVLPLGALDGGQIAFTTIEAITQKKLSDNFKIGVNIVSLILFGALFLYLTFRDSLALFGY